MRFVRTIGLIGTGVVIGLAVTLSVQATTAAQAVPRERFKAGVFETSGGDGYVPARTLLDSKTNTCYMLVLGSHAVPAGITQAPRAACD